MEQFTDFANGTSTFGDLVRNMYHEYQHLQDGYANPQNKMEVHEDEFLSHFNTLTNTVLPPYSPYYGKVYTQLAEGYYNYIPQAVKDSDPIINNRYGNLVRSVKKQYGLDPTPNPNQKPPPKKGKISGQITY